MPKPGGGCEPDKKGPCFLFFSPFPFASQDPESLDAWETQRDGILELETSCGFSGIQGGTNAQK